MKKWIICVTLAMIDCISAFSVEAQNSRGTYKRLFECVGRGLSTMLNKDESSISYVNINCGTESKGMVDVFSSDTKIGDVKYVVNETKNEKGYKIMFDVENKTYLPITFSVIFVEQVYNPEGQLWEEKMGDMQSYQLDGYEIMSLSRFTDNEIIKFNINANLTNQ